MGAVGSPDRSLGLTHARGLASKGGARSSQQYFSLIFRLQGQPISSASQSSKAPKPRPRKALGQHFLIDNGVLNRIADAAELIPQDLVLEIGPGTGALTRHLVSSGATVTAVELDPVLAAGLTDRLGNPPNLTVVQSDARTLDVDSLLGSAKAYKVVGNLPYYAANPIIRRFLEFSRSPGMIVATLQAEVARTITASPGSMGLLSVAVQFYAAPTLVCTVPPKAFRPPPKVDSAVIKLDVFRSPAVAVSNEEAFFNVVRAGFSAPRKQLRNSLAHGLKLETGLIGKLLTDVDLDGSRRPATLSLEEWAGVYNAWESLAEHTPTE